jgi:hypothetical protein
VRFLLPVFLTIFGSLPGNATPSLGAVGATPMTAVFGTPTQITVTASITDSSLIAGGVNLLQLNANGTSTIIGTMHDDGLNGDAYAGDLVFTRVVTLNSPSASQIQLQVSAAFKGVLQRVKSPIMNVFFQAANAPQQSITALAQNLAVGNISSALVSFLDSDKASAILNKLNAAGQQQLANAFAAALLVSSNGDLRLFRVPWTAPNGSVLTLEVALEPNSNGNWVIVSW